MAKTAAKGLAMRRLATPLQIGQQSVFAAEAIDAAGKSLGFLPLSHVVVDRGQMVAVTPWLAAKAQLPVAADMAHDRAIFRRADPSALALDRASVREHDPATGRLIVKTSNICRACISPYFGEEIPGWRDLGLDPRRTYQMLRDPAEMERAVPTANSIPLLVRHKASIATDHPAELVIGTVGSDAEWAAPFIKNSLVVWDGKGIDLIESGEQCELSPGYNYTPDMTPGTFNGEHHDGVMRNISFNHLAIVEEGRQGPDVVVQDSKPKELNMANTRLSRRVSLAKGALFAAVAPEMATDAAPIIKRGMTGLTFETFTPAVKGTIARLIAADVLAADEGETLAKRIEEHFASKDHEEPIDGVAEDEDEEEMAESDHPDSLQDLYLIIKALQKEVAAIKSGQGAQDNPPEFPGKPRDPEPDRRQELVSKSAMDAAIARASKQATVAALSIGKEIAAAERRVEPLVGRLDMSFDSALGVYHEAFRVHGTNARGSTVAECDAILDLLLPPVTSPRPRIAADSTISDKDFREMFPEYRAPKRA